MIWSDYYWAVLLILTFGVAVPANILFLLTGHRNRDLIHTMWRWTNNDPVDPFMLKRSWPLILMAIFMTWLTFHLTFGYL